MAVDLQTGSSLLKQDGVDLLLQSESPVDDLLANNVESTTTLSVPDVGQEHTLTADDVQSVSSVSVPSLGIIHNLIADNTLTLEELAVLHPNLDTVPYSLDSNMWVATEGIYSTTELTKPTLAEVSSEDTLLAENVQSVTGVSIPDVGQEHALTVNDVVSTTELTSPSLGQEHALLADDVVSTTQVSVPNPGQEHGLTADDVESETEASTPAVGQEHALNASDTESATELTTPTLAEVSGGVDNLLAEDLVSVTQVSVPNVGQEHVLLANNVESTTTLSEPTLDRPVVVPITTSSSGGFFSPSQKDIDRLVAVFDKTSKKKRKKLQRIKRLEEAAVKVLATDTNKALAQDAVKTINFVQMLEDTEQDYRRKRAEELLNQAAALVREIEREEEDILFLVANPVRPPKKAPFIDNEEDVFLLLAA